MKNSEIVQNNKLIAEFMGDSFRTSPNVIENLKGLRLKYPKKWGEYLRFNSSWNWLMPVVKKINTLEDVESTVTIYCGRIVIQADFKEVVEVGGSEEIDLFEALVKFVKWYNDRNVDPEGYPACKKYRGETVLLNEDGNCSLCEGDCIEQSPVMGAFDENGDTI